MQGVFETGNPQFFSASGTIGGRGKLLGFFCSAAGGTIAISTRDSGGTVVTIASAFSPVAGVFYPLPFNFNGDVTVTIAGAVSACFAVVKA